MKAVNLNKAATVSDKSLYGSRDFNDLANNLWRDNLDFNIFDDSGYLTEDAKNFIRANNIEKKDDETYGDAIFRFAEFRELGYQVDKAPKKRSDVKFSGSMIMSNFMDRSEIGESFDLKHDEGGFEDGIDLIEMMTEDSYSDDLGSEEITFRGVRMSVPKHARTIVGRTKTIK